MRKLSLIFILFLPLLSISQDCSETFELYNQILVDHYIHELPEPQFELDALNINCLGCGQADD